MANARLTFRVDSIQASFGGPNPPADTPKDVILVAHDLGQPGAAAAPAKGFQGHIRLVQVSADVLAALPQGQLVAFDLTPIAEPAPAKADAGKSPEPAPIHPEHATA